MDRSLGLLEVSGMVAAIACIDTMVKAAFVEITRIEQIGSGIIVIMIQGDLANVQYALERGSEKADNHGQLLGLRVIARPYEGLDILIAPQEKVIKVGEN